LAQRRIGWSPCMVRIRDTEYAALRRQAVDDVCEAAYRAGHELSRMRAVEGALDRWRSGTAEG